MSYYHQALLQADSLESVVKETTAALKEAGFGVLTTIDMQATLREKLGVEIQRYTILGACNPPFAHRAVQAEPHIGVMLPCNVVVRELTAGQYEVAAINPIASMQAIPNEDLGDIAEEINNRLKNVVEQLAQ